MDALDQRIGFIGGGNMAEAIMGALIRSEVSRPGRLQASDISAERRQHLEENYGIQTSENNNEVLAENDVVILAVKPQIIDKVLKELAPQAAKTENERKLFISIAAGVPISKIEQALYDDDEQRAASLPIVRVMPNTPALVLAVMSGISANRHVITEDMYTAETIFRSTGRVLACPESDLNAVTAVSGSGPAYIFYVVEAMVEAGVSLGLSEDDATALTLQTLKGALTLLEDSDDSPASLREKVTSPGGTTEAALKVMQEQKIKESIIAAMKAACQRAEELSR